MDKHGYPEIRELNIISRWNIDWENGHNDYHQLMEYVESKWSETNGIWQRASNGEDYIRYNISTGGWSGNEDLIGAMKQNKMFWLMCWYMSQRGGHYEFRVKKEEE